MPLPAASGGGEAVLSREQAIEATALWAVGDRDGAHQTLQRLDATLPSDNRVQLNLLVSGYYADANSSLGGLAAELEAWLESHATDRADRHSGYAAAAINYGLILFLQQQHARALSVLEPLFEGAELLPDGSALCLCVLLLEIYLDSMQLRRAVSVLQYLQAATAPLSPRAGTAEGDESGSGADAASSGAGGGSEDQQQQARRPSSSASSPSYRAQQQQQQQQQQPGSSPQRHQLPLQQLPAGGSGAAEAGQGIDLPSMSRLQSPLMQQVHCLLQQQADSAGDASGRVQWGAAAHITPDACALLHLYKARLALACSSHKAAKKELRALLAAQPDSAAAVLLKTQLEVLRQQPRRALKTVGPVLAGPACQGSIRTRLQMLNLVAALHHQLGKHHVAALYLSTALTQHQQAQQQQLLQEEDATGAGEAGKQSSAAPGAGRAGAAPAGHRPRWLLPDGCDALSYNLGLQQLALHNWGAAQECFEAAAGKCFTQPQMWLRLAEACLGMYHEQQQQQQQQGRGAEPLGQQPQLQEQGAALLQQAAVHLSTGLALLQGEHEAAAKQLEAAAAATAAAIAAGEPPPLAEGPPWLAAATAAAAAAAAAAALNGGSSQAQSGASAAGDEAAQAGGSAAAAAAAAAASVLSSWPPGEALDPGMAAVQQSLLANQAYVALQLQDPQQALASAQALLSCSSMSQHLHHLGSSYAAEALCLLGRPEEAAQQLHAHLSRFMDSSSSSTGTGANPAAVAAGGGPPAAAPAPAADTGAAVAGSASLSIKSDDDGSCKSWSRGTGMHPNGSGDNGASLVPGLHAAMLHNMSAVLALQGNMQESQRHSAMAAAVAARAGAGNPQPH